jgi:hypothetical protein
MWKDSKTQTFCRRLAIPKKPTQDQDTHRMIVCPAERVETFIFEFVIEPDE